MKFIIRDDDLNYFSSPADIKWWYDDIFARKIPVSFATIPFVKPSSDVYTNNAPKENKECPISGNAELTSYVKSNPLIEIVQHGCTHETKDGLYEYQRNEDLFNETARGKNELEQAFARKVNVFAPPHDWLGSHGVKAIEAARLNVVRGRGTGTRNIIMRSQYVKVFLQMLWFKITHISNAHVPVYPYVLDFGFHKEMCSYRLEDEDIFEGLAYAHRKDGIFVVVAHLHFYTDEKKRLLMRLIDKANEYGAEFVRASEIFS